MGLNIPRFCVTSLKKPHPTENDIDVCDISATGTDERQKYRKSAPLSNLTLNLDGTTMNLGDSLANRKPQTGSTFTTRARLVNSKFQELARLSTSPGRGNAMKT